MGVKCLLSYPDAMMPDLREKGVAPWSKGGEFESFGRAIEAAREVAEVKNMPIQVTCMGQKMTVYPKSIGY